MKTSKLVFISDIHLDSSNESRFFIFTELLKSLQSDGTTDLFLVGDIFDFWMGSKNVFKERYKPIVDSIQGAIASGINVYYFQGNHDVDLKKFWEKDIGAKVYAGPHIFNFNNQKIRVEHGDNFNPEDKGYFLWKAFLTSRFASFLACLMPNFLMGRLSDFLSEKSRASSDKNREAYKDKIISLLHNYVESEAQKEEFDLIISGHIHFKDDYSFNVDGRQVRSVNLGTWLDDKEKWIFRV